MEVENKIELIEKKVEALLEGHPTHFLVEVRIKPTNNIKVFIDADEGIMLSSLIQYNRKLHKILEESPIFGAEDFSLEVSSPGLDEPLKKMRQYFKNLGRYIEVTSLDGTKTEGKLIEAANEEIVVEVETGKGKKKEIKQERILLSDIKTTKIQIKF